MTRPARYEWLKHVQTQVRNKTLSANAGHVALTLGVLYASNGHDEAWPSQAELARTTGRSRRTVQNALHELEQHRLIETTRGQTDRTSGNIYRLRTP